MCPSGMLRVGRQRVQRQRASERDEQGWWGGGMLPSSAVFRFWDGCPLALQPGGRGAWLSFRPGGVCVCVSDPLFWWGRPLSPPLGAAQTPRHLQRHCKRASAGGSADCIRA